MSDDAPSVVPVPRIVYLSHPQVAVDPAVPVDRWELSEVGRARALAMLERPWVRGIARVISSAERKALTTAELLAAHLDVPVEVRPDTGEMDRSATGVLPPEEFERVANGFFDEPHHSVRGWERAVDAQARITGALADLLGPHTDADVAVVGHGGVGTLWYCALAGLPIDRLHDQPGQGHYFTVDAVTGRPLHGWRPIDADGPPPR